MTAAVKGKLQFAPATIKVMDPFKRVKMVEGMELGDTGLGYWVRFNSPTGIPDFMLTVTRSGLGISSTLSAKSCEAQLRKLAKLDINWHEVSIDNYKNHIYGGLFREYVRITRIELGL